MYLTTLKKGLKIVQGMYLNTYKIVHQCKNRNKFVFMHKIWLKKIKIEIQYSLFLLSYIDTYKKVE